MKIFKATLDDCDSAQGTVVVIDVVRAFTTAAYAFSSGAERIILAAEVEEALALKRQFPGAMVMGEVGGALVEGFDLWNSPGQLKDKNLTGKTLIQRTSAGTQGIVRSRQAEVLLAASFVVAQATIDWLRLSGTQAVTVVETGTRDGVPAVEDEACADYLAERLRGNQVPVSSYIYKAQAVTKSFGHKDPELAKALIMDIPYCLEPDRFSFVMRVERINGLLEMRPERIH